MKLGFCYTMGMQKVVVVQMVYNGMRYLPDSLGSIFAQTYPNIQVVAVINGNADGSKEYIQEHFPQTIVIDKGENLQFARGHNLVFSTIDADFYQLVNQDLILEPDYIANMVKVFQDEAVGAVNGKIYQYDFQHKQKQERFDTTGIVVSRSGRGRSRGQYEVDKGQYEEAVDLIAVDGAACIYRQKALEAVKYPVGKNHDEYFDESFGMYWEDVDLGFRMVNAGWRCVYEPSAVGYHGRTASASPGGYLKILAFIKHHKKLPLWLRQLNYQNHIKMFIKNAPRWYWQFFARELAYHLYLLIFETAVLKKLPALVKALPSVLRKRRWIKKRRQAKISYLESLLF